jgi:p-cumate 2,3-dioxygenase beta subunit
MSAARTSEAAVARVTRAEVEDFLYMEADLLDGWRLDEWLGLLTPDATYRVPSNDAPDADPRSVLFTIADDIERIRARVKRLKNVHAHAESPRSRTRRMIHNVRVHGQDGDLVTVTANFIVYRFRRIQETREYVGRYEYSLRVTKDGLRIKDRRAVFDSAVLGELGAVSFIL